MKMIVDVHIFWDKPGNKHVYSTVRKEFETNLVPMAGIQFEDSAWKNPHAIKSVTINPTEGYYHLYVDGDTGNTKDECDQIKQMYHSHGWK
jgi:hypothetical protein